MRDRFEASGEIAQVDVIGALKEIARLRESTRLVLQRGTETFAFDFEGGDLVGLAAPEEVGPAQMLISAGRVRRETYEGLVVPSGGDRFETACESGVISRREAVWARKRAAIESLSRVMVWTDGAYRREAPREPATVHEFRLSIERWILELFLRSDDRVLVLHHLGPTDAPLALAPGFGERFASLGLTADADAVTDLIDGSRTAADVARQAPVEEFAALKLLAALVVLGLVHVAYDEPFPGRARAETAAVEPDGMEEEPTAPEAPFAAPPAPPASPEPLEIPLAALTAPESEPPEQPELPLGEDVADESPAARVSPRPAGEPPPSSGPSLAIPIVVLLLASAGLATWLLTRTGAREAAPRPGPAASPAPRAPERVEKPLPVPAAASGALEKPPVSPEPGAGAPAVSVRRPPAPRPAPARPRPTARNGAAAFTIQVEVACEQATIERARQAAGARGHVWTSPIRMGGRDCRRVLWGRYRDLASARQARDRLPRLFFERGNRPAVLSLEKIGGR